MKPAQIDSLLASLDTEKVAGWEDIGSVLSWFEETPQGASDNNYDALLNSIGKGAAFITYDYGIDGVSIEVFKYATCLEAILRAAAGDASFHFIAGEFTNRANTVIRPHWKRFAVENFNGWSKWHDGKWFSRMFYEDMPEGSKASTAVARHVWSEGISFARQLTHYLVANDIRLIVPVNVNSNPGNLASSLGVALASEISGVHVLNSNHDFYWEGGAPAENRRPGEAPGIRDHFFRNHGNRPFFEVFRRLLPWNGRRWIQVNINRKQSDTLVREHGFSRDVVREVGTAIDNSFFSRCSLQEKMLYRGTMAHILSNGSPIIRPVALDDHLASLSVWMKNQVPVVCAADNDIEVNIASPSALYLLQPTRVIARKRIERDCHLLGALFDHEPFRSAFDEHPDRTLTLHITGPVPIEHEADLAAVLAAFGAVLRRLPSPLARRVFIAFSVGCEDHESLADEGLDRLHIDTIYKLADAVVFPSKTEGRGLPIVESSAARVPVICSRYCPEEVFAEVVGEHLDPDRRIRYTLFPEDGFTPKILGEITDIILFPARIEERIEHNYRAVEARYGMQAMTTSFHGFLRAFLPV